jgi:hypothetical protein
MSPWCLRFVTRNVDKKKKKEREEEKEKEKE